MKTRELIKILTALAETHGNQEVIDQDWQNIDGASIVEDEGELRFKLE